MNLTSRLRSAHGLLRSGAFAGIVMLLVTVSAAAAQERSLSWPSIHVDAHLDSAGRLEIRERQSIRFNGTGTAVNGDLLFDSARIFHSAV